MHGCGINIFKVKFEFVTIEATQKIKCIFTNFEKIQTQQILYTISLHASNRNIQKQVTLDLQPVKSKRCFYLHQPQHRGCTSTLVKRGRCHRCVCGVTVHDSARLLVILVHLLSILLSLSRVTWGAGANHSWHLYSVCCTVCFSHPCVFHSIYSVSLYIIAIFIFPCGYIAPIFCFISLCLYCMFNYSVLSLIMLLIRSSLCCCNNIDFPKVGQT